MNRNQKIILWVGIVAFVLMGLFPPIDFDETALDLLLVQWVMVVVVTGGLVVTFKGKRKL